jgi:preprotein translocase subunit YajC
MPAMPLPLLQAAPSGGNPIVMFLPMILIFAVFYLFIIRPQQKREKERKNLIAAVKKGDKVITIGGVHGTVVQVDETTVIAQVDTNTKLRFEKNAIGQVVEG